MVFRKERENKMKTILTLVLISSLAIMSGCVHKPPIAPFELTPGKIVPQNQAIVFGKVEFLDFDNKPINWADVKAVDIGIGGYAKYLVIYVIEKNTDKGFAYVLRNDGSFFWHLPPGIYEFRAYHQQTGQTYNKTFFPKGKEPKFTVLEGEPLIYVGTLITGSAVPATSQDEYDKAVGKFKSHFPEIKAEPIKRMWSK
jgi:hypothetical protein